MATKARKPGAAKAKSAGSSARRGGGAKAARGASRPAKTAKPAAAKKAPARKAPKKGAAPSPKRPKARPAPARPAASLPSAATGGPDGDLLTLRDAPAPYEIIEGEPYMGPKQKEHFRRILESWRHELMEEVDRTVRYMQDEAANFPDANDRATQESEFSLELRTRDRERKLIRKIDEALTRIETDEYGYCVTCGDEIGIRRLEARPIATQCIDCKERDERKERQNRGL